MSLTGLLISNIGGPFAIAGGNAARVALGDLCVALGAPVMACQLCGSLTHS